MTIVKQCQLKGVRPKQKALEAAKNPFIDQESVENLEECGELEAVDEQEIDYVASNVEVVEEQEELQPEEKKTKTRKKEKERKTKAMEKKNQILRKRKQKSYYRVSHVKAT